MTAGHAGEGKTRVEPLDKAMIAKTHPSMYRMHRFWARKPHNVIRAHIEHYTSPGEIVLDPFCGSGVSVAEALKAGRKAIGIDLNPIATILTMMTVKPIDLEEFELAFREIRDNVKDEIDSLYLVGCSVCGADVVASSFAWQRDPGEPYRLVRVMGQCSQCGSKQEREPTTEERNRSERVQRRRVPFFYPENVPLHSSAKRSVDYVHELFTRRNTIALSVLLESIQRVADADVRRLLQLVFTSGLAQSSKLNSIDMREGRKWRSRGWTINNYWIPRGYLERNVWNCFESRYRKVLRGKRESQREITIYGEGQSFEDLKVGGATCLIATQSATDLAMIPDNSVDYVFTDPPYGGSVPYFGLSLMWASWLGIEGHLNFGQEILISERGDYHEELKTYKDDLRRAFSEMYRVLKPNGWASVTFHNREIAVWNALIAAAVEAHFEYVNDVYQIPAVISAKSQLARSGSMTGDIIINFHKPVGVPRRLVVEERDVEGLMLDEATRIIAERRGRATTDQLMRGIIHVLMLNGVLDKTEEGIDYVLHRYFEEVSNNEWALKEKEEKSLIDYVPLDKRIEWIVQSVLTRGRANLDEILVAIFTTLKNGRTPESREIMKVLGQVAVPVGEKWRLATDEDRAVQPELWKKLADVEEVQAMPVVDSAEEARTHEQMIRRIVDLALGCGYQVWVGKAEQGRDENLRKLSLPNLEFPPLSQREIHANDIDQIDTIWLKNRTIPVALFEVENTTRAMTCIARMGNLTQLLPHLSIPTFIVAPDGDKRHIEKRLDAVTSKIISAGRPELWRYILYSDLLRLHDHVTAGDTKISLQSVWAISYQVE